MTATWAEWTANRTEAVRCRMPAAFRHLRVEHPDVVSWCERVMTGDPNSLLLTGPVGTGKSGNAWACWPHLIGSGWVGSFRGLTEQQFLDALLPDGDPYTARTAERVDVLLLDDLGVTSPSDWSRSRLFALIDSRWTAGKPTVLTSNLTTKRLSEHIGERALSRIRPGLTVVTLTGKDRR